MRNTNFCKRIINIITATTTFICFNTKWKKYRLISININNFCGLVLHSWLFIEIQLKKFAFAKPDKIVNLMKNTFLTNLNIFIYTMLFFFHQILMNIFNMINISSIVIYTKIIDIAIQPCFFSYYLLTSLLKCFLSITDLLQSHNLLL